MPRTLFRPFPSVDKQMRSLGERLKLARLRRAVPASLFAERLGISRDTLHRLERGDPGISLGTYMRALRVLGLDKDMDTVARDDELGRKLQDLELTGGRKTRAHARPLNFIDTVEERPARKTARKPDGKP
ncbi:helix-turn-helix domain-containing protein [Paraburkholderia sp. D15]|uniref:helix-turn-helix domain-containing protein n=1 Tax=Paraburkholderia sp. D15 TaxID=2880218 RepID=UPI00247A3156|nr:helix-turn-helix transcriptional regulator [Paraburkholderia sp. D15]WGS53823.1 helix-turn-helix domain-containing protein [Paraburkholderia sp. D15]